MKLRILAVFFAVVFSAGAIIHIYMGQFHPDTYGDFSRSALPPLDMLWLGIVMPNIRILTLIMALIEAGVAWGLWRGGTSTSRAAWVACLFFFSLFFLGFAFKADSLAEDFLFNRIGSVVMFCLMLPVALDRNSRPAR